MKENSRNWKLLAYGVLAGLSYGLGIRALYHWFPSGRYFSVIYFAFVLVLPFCMGFLSAFLVERKQEQSPWIWVVLGILPVAGGLIGAVATLLEGWICVVMFAPIGLVCGMQGGLCGGLAAWLTHNLSLACIAFLPLALGPLEHNLLWRYQTRTVQSSNDIHASPAIVWDNIKSVSAISHGELSPSWTRAIGFPRPLDATLSHEGVGGIRHARFDGACFLSKPCTFGNPIKGWRSPLKPRRRKSQLRLWTFTSRLEDHTSIRCAASM